MLDTDVPPLLSVGKLNKVGFAFHQIDEDNSYLENRNSGAIHYCTCVHEVPLVCPAAAVDEMIPKIISIVSTDCEVSATVDVKSDEEPAEVPLVSAVKEKLEKKKKKGSHPPCGSEHNLFTHFPKLKGCPICDDAKTQRSR